MFDRKIWDTIQNKKRCAFKLISKTMVLCKNKYNVTGICNEFSCPLANTKYATVREENDVISLYIKLPEHANNPKFMYKKIELSYDYVEALNEIDENLNDFTEEVKHKCRQRLTKLFEYLERRILFEKEPLPQLVPRKKKMNRREKIRALKALTSLNFEDEIGKEIMIRLKEGVMGKEVKEAYEDAEKKAKKKSSKIYVADIQESEDIDDMNFELKKNKEKGKKKSKDKELNW